MDHRWKNAWVVLALTASLTGRASASSYLGFDLGELAIDGAKQLLREGGGTFEEGYGYKGYDQDLPALKVLQYPSFEKHGKLREAWLNFSPKGVLYMIALTYGDSGETFAVLKDALDAKYGKPRAKGFGFQNDYVYRDGKAEITLKRNTFGFGDAQTTELVYLWLPMSDEVTKMKAAIENDIRRKNAAKAGADL